MFLCKVCASGTGHREECVESIAASSKEASKKKMNDTACNYSLKNSESCSSPSSMEDLRILSTIYEDAELNIRPTCARMPLTTELSRQRYMPAENRPQFQLEASPINWIWSYKVIKFTSCKVLFTSYTTSTQDSELQQSLSSDAQTDDTSSLPDSGIWSHPLSSSSHHARFSSFLPTSIQDWELQSLSSDPQTDDASFLADCNIWSHPRSSSSHHAMFSSFLPTSIQDWELQSLSSDPQTDDASFLADCNIEYSPAYNCKGHWSKQLPAMKTSAGLNKDNLPCQFIPRIQRLPESSLQPDPNVFASELIDKLNKVKQERELGEKLEESIKKLEERDTHSTDSGTVHFTPKNEPASYNSPPVHIYQHFPHHASNIFSPNVMSSDQTGARASKRLSKDNSHQSSSRKVPRTDMSSSCVDSGVSVACDPLPISSARERRQNKKFPVVAANSIATNNTTNDITVIGYLFAGESVPYKTKLPGKNVTLKQFKSLLSKKGNYRYFFRKASDEFGTGIINEEITDDNEILPHWEEKIFAIIQPVE